jgi:hypothetical protein
VILSSTAFNNSKILEIVVSVNRCLNYGSFKDSAKRKVSLSQKMNSKIKSDN